MRDPARDFYSGPAAAHAAGAHHVALQRLNLSLDAFDGLLLVILLGLGEGHRPGGSGGGRLGLDLRLGLRLGGRRGLLGLRVSHGWEGLGARGEG